MTDAELLRKLALIPRIVALHIESEHLPLHFRPHKQIAAMMHELQTLPGAVDVPEQPLDDGCET